MRVYVAATYHCPECGYVMWQDRRSESSVLVYLECGKQKKFGINDECVMAGRTFKVQMQAIDVIEVWEVTTDKTSA